MDAVPDLLKPLRDAREPHRQLIERANDAANSGEMDEANRLYLEYLERVPDDPTVLFNMGTMRMRRAGREVDPRLKNQISGEALSFFMRVFGSPYPDYETKAHAANNAGLVVMDLGNVAGAKKCFEDAELYGNLHQPGSWYRAPRVNYCDVLLFEGKYDEADKMLADIISSDSDLAGPQFSRGCIALVHGDLKRGWRDYRARFSMSVFKSKMVETDKPLWDGEPL